MNSSTTIEPVLSDSVETPFDVLSKAISEYVTPIYQEYSLTMVAYDYPRMGGPLDVALGGIFTQGSRRRDRVRHEKARDRYEDIQDLANAIRAHALEYDTPMTHATFVEKFKFRMRFLMIIFSLPAGNNDSNINLQHAFEEFLSARKLIDLSHF